MSGALQRFTQKIVSSSHRLSKTRQAWGRAGPTILIYKICDGTDELLGCIWFRKKEVGVCKECLLAIVHSLARCIDDRQERPPFPCVLRYPEPRLQIASQMDIHKQQVDGLIRVQERLRAFERCCGEHLVARIAQHRLDEHANLLIIFDDKYYRHARIPTAKTLASPLQITRLPHKTAFSPDGYSSQRTPAGWIRRAVPPNPKPKN